MKIYKAETFIPSGSSIGIIKTERRLSEALHRHEFIEIIYICDGRAVERIDGIPYDVERGDLLFINYGSQHSFDTIDGFTYYNICFSPEVVSDAIITPENAVALLSLTAFDEMRGNRNGGKISFPEEERPEIEAIISAMFRESKEKLPSSAKVIESYMNILITKMLRKTEIGEGSVVTDIWQKLEAYISENLNEELTLAALAKKSFYNPSYFSRIFKQKFGTSLSEYVRKKRMDYAKKLLAETDMSVEKIIAKAGFSDRTAFYHAFSKSVELTPAEYRSRERCKKI